MILFSLIHNELIKTFSKARTYIGFITIAILIPVIMILVRIYGMDLQENVVKELQDSFYIAGSLVNGYLVSYHLMNVLWIHFPFFIMLVAGDILAGEGNAGTFRLLLTRPASRSAILTGKFLATFIYTWSIVLFLGFFSLGVGGIVVGTGDLLVLDKGILILSANQTLWRFLFAYVLACLVQTLVASLTFTFSSFANNSIGPIIGSYAIIVVFYILSFVKISALETVQPYLFTTYFDVFFKPFQDPIPWREIGKDVLIISVHIVVFYFISLFHFVKKDIKT